MDSGPTMPTLPEELHLREGGPVREGGPPGEGQAMLIRMRTADLEVLGPRLDVEAEPGSTRLNVNEGRVRVTRLVDGSVAELPALHQVVASGDDTEARNLP